MSDSDSELSPHDVQPTGKSINVSVNSNHNIMVTSYQ